MSRDWESDAARIEGWMRMGMILDQKFRGWQIYAEDAEGRIPVTILVPADFKRPKGAGI